MAKHKLIADIAPSVKEKLEFVASLRGISTSKLISIYLQSFLDLSVPDITQLSLQLFELSRREPFTSTVQFRIPEDLFKALELRANESLRSIRNESALLIIFTFNSIS